MQNKIDYEKKYCQKQAIIFNAFNQIITNTITGDIMILFLTDILLFKTSDITFIVSLIPLLSIIRIPLIFIFRGGDKIKMIKVSVVIKSVLVSILCFFPSNLIDISKYILLIVIYQIAVEFGVGICWQPLMRIITSNNDRGRFFSRMRFVFMMLNSIYVFIISVFIGDVMREEQYKILLGISLFGLLLQLYSINKIGKKHIIQKSEPSKTKNKSIIHQIKDNKKIFWALLLELMFLCAGFTLNVVYLKTVLGYSSRLVSLYITINNLGGTLLLPIIGKLLDTDYKRGSKYISILYVIYLALLLCLPVYEKSNLMNIVIIVPFAVFSGIIVAGVYLLMTILQHGLIKYSEDSFIVLNLYQMIVYVASFLITNILGSIILKAEIIKIYVASLAFDLYKIVNIILITICILVVSVVIKKIKLV